MTDEQYFHLIQNSGRHLTDGEHEVYVEVNSLANNPDYVKCPRCWHYTHSGLSNHDCLCDRCCRILIDAWPNHESVPHIIENWRKQGFISSNKELKNE
jgi:hypothetical protein